MGANAESTLYIFELGVDEIDLGQKRSGLCFVLRCPNDTLAPNYF